MVEPVMKVLLMTWMATCATHFNVPIEKVQAVAIVESRPAHGKTLELRVGRLGRSKYWGPMGLNQNCFSKEDADCYRNPWLDIYYGTKALSRCKDLRKYNTECSPAYLKEVKRITRLLKSRTEQ